MRLLLLATLAGCDYGTLDSTSVGDAGFCTTLDDAGSWDQDDGGGAAESGQLVLRMVTDATEDPLQPEYITYVSYTLEETQKGGVQTTGKTSGDGIVRQVLGAGEWEFKSTVTRGPLSCRAEMLFPVAAETTTNVCTVMSCEQ